ncbi:ribosomal protein S18-alanine N-acetyltransferase [Halorussus gelatinilyticus]|uniref:Ribosomal protein S18-alanine N-acetyltransferase n=1 Tax=Halorussus gelatinilyticus TaxID=2937524 RepID=A0A8U0INT6_9EURY|nr:ribosomal protein S18-alanine N-acetyltransferase [Halorussus gelatinilyticus]UPW02216.1 ribosomal protein S18-alanine N-acetyltransferase [Halorussus gelatinilyticus]
MTTTPAEDGDDVRIRQAVQADLLAVLRIERASFDQPWPFSAFERYLGDPGFLVAVAREESSGYLDGDGNESVVGYVVANLVPNHGRAFGHVKDIAVHPEYRGEGIGGGLLERALTVLGTRGAQSVKLEVRASNDRAVGLYREFGFEYLRTVPRYYDDGEDALILVVDLDE